MQPGHSALSSQPSSLSLREFETCEVALSPEVYSALRLWYAGRIDVAPADRAGAYRLSARDYVGRIGLPGGGMLVIRPKVPVANLFYMLCADAGLAEIKPPPTNLESNTYHEDITAFVVSTLLDATERLLGQGLYRGYVSRQESSTPVRGRIVIGEQVHRYGELKHRHVCAFAELNVDTPENRILLAALRHVPRLLQTARPPEAGMLRQARRQTERLEGVGQVSRNEAIALLRSVSLHRLNAAYGAVLLLCRLVLQHLTFEERPGPYPFASFLVNMPRLFESFLTARLRTLLPRHGLKVIAQRHDYLDEERTVGIRPDLLVMPHKGKEPLVVVDFKYRDLDEPGATANTDLYQLSAYMDRYNLRAGMLVYPRFEHVPATRLKLRGTPKQLHLAGIDLGSPDPRDIEDECATIAGKITQISGSK
ncbi:MAG: 5-methylcytosine-specific restriction enzyme subunit McrC [Chloroflexia bacterium]|jgi:5-methylcytosine-specific restriction enzyme subunit McrC|nr:5-methylcytosine-specific restriction enzyme subunit McrC [Chloroflexia bacterium]